MEEEAEGSVLLVRTSSAYCKQYVLRRSHAVLRSFEYERANITGSYANKQISSRCCVYEYYCTATAVVAPFYIPRAYTRGRYPTPDILLLLSCCTWYIHTSARSSSMLCTLHTRQLVYTLDDSSCGRGVTFRSDFYSRSEPLGRVTTHELFAVSTL